MLVLAATAFYTYVGQLVPQKEVLPPQETIIRADLTTADMVTVGRQVMEGKGLCMTCHTIGRSGALRFPDLDGVAGRAATRVPGLSEVEYFAQSLYAPDSFIVAGLQPGNAGDQQAPDRPHRSGDPLRDRLPPDARRDGDGDAPDESRLLHGSGRDAWRAARPESRAWRAAAAHRAAAQKRDARCACRRQPRRRLRPPRRRERP